MRVVIDPGVLIAAALTPSGTPGRVLREVTAGSLELVVSPLVLLELQEVLARPKFRPYLSEDECAEYVSGIARVSSVHADPEFEPGITPDPADDYLVALARDCHADALVSGDGDLTSIANASPPVLTPRQLLDRL